MINLDTKNNDGSIQKVVFKQFGQKAEKIDRIATGLNSEVYSIRVSNSDYIVRLNQRDSLKGSDKYIPLFKSKGIKVPNIVAEDYSKQIIPYNWQIMSKIEGTDLGNVISTLTKAQLKSIAEEISSIIRKLITIPTNGLFGYVGTTEDKLRRSLNEVLEEMLTTIKERNEKTGVVKKEYISVMEKILIDYSDYFKKVSSQFYFDDISSKNVMVSKGEFKGIVDLDYIAYGDYLDAVGRIKTSWYGTKYGDYYSNAIMDSLQLTDNQRKIVTLWALINRIYWQSEIGVQFNQNTSENIDKERVLKGNKIIDGLIREMSLTY